MPPETSPSPKSVVRDLFDLFRETDPDRLTQGLEALLDPKFVDHTPSPGADPGRGSVLAKLQGLRAAFPDLDFRLEGLVAEGETVAARWTMTGTQQGMFGSIGPSHRPVKVAGMDFYVVRNGRIAEHWHVVDELSMLKQLRVVA